MELANLGKRLKHIRKQAGFTRQDIETLYNIPVSTLNFWETRNTDIGVKKLLQYLDIYKTKGIFISIETLLASEEIISPSAPSTRAAEPFNEISQTTLGASLLGKANIFFYADQFQRIHYLNTSYYHLIAENNFCISLKNQIYITNLVPILEQQAWAAALAEVMLGNVAKIEYTIKNTRIVSLQLIPNFNAHGQVIGVAALPQSPPLPS